MQSVVSSDRKLRCAQKSVLCGCECKEVSTILESQALQDDGSRSKLVLQEDENEREAQQKLEETWSWGKGTSSIKMAEPKCDSQECDELFMTDPAEEGLE